MYMGVTVEEWFRNRFPSLQSLVRSQQEAVTFDPRVTAVHQHKNSMRMEEEYVREEAETTLKKKKKMFPMYTF